MKLRGEIRKQAFLAIRWDRNLTDWDRDIAYLFIEEKIMGDAEKKDSRILAWAAMRGATDIDSVENDLPQLCDGRPVDRHKIACAISDALIEAIYGILKTIEDE